MGRSDDHDSELNLGASSIDLDASSSIIPDSIGDPSLDAALGSGAPMDLTGRDLDGLIIQRKLGAGGMGEVWLAHDEDLDIAVAVKVLPAHLAADQGFVMRFLREARAVAKLDHSNIVRVLQAGKREVTGQFLRLMVMEYVEGQDALQALHAAPGLRLPPQRCAEITLAAAKALKYAHGKGVIHRDVKPANILISKDGESIKLLDFGLARLGRSATLQSGNTSSEDAALESGAPAPSSTGTILGTPQYMPPEQCEGRIADGRADIYSLGITLYELLTGSLPFTGDTVFSIIEGHVRKPLEFPADAFDDVPPMFRELIAGMCEKKPDDRWALKQVIEKLDHFLGHSGSASSGSAASGSAALQSGSSTHDSSVSGSRTNIIKRETSFVGRGGELAAIGDLLAKARLVTVVGPGGVGKTRITQEYGLTQAATPDYPGGVWFCDLTEARSVDGICYAVSQGIGVPLTQADSVKQIEAILSMRDNCLMIFDNFEQVVEFAGETIGRWMAKAPNVKFLTSSREPLHLEGEKSFPLAPLSGAPLSRAASSSSSHIGRYDRGYLPHIDATGLIQFVTFRLADALPASHSDAQTSMKFDAVDAELDAGYGACYLARADIASIVQNTLRHFDEQRYRLLAWVIMPNHVHVLFRPIHGHALPDIVESWKKFSARRANELLGRKGPFWQRDYFDRYIRDNEHLLQTVEYIVRNPVSAGLCSATTDWAFTGCNQAKVDEELGRKDAALESGAPNGAPREIPPAIQLFVDRASDVKRGFALDESNRDAIAKIVDQLDGIPLAIELAASRCSALKPQKILERLPRRFDLLKGRRQDASARQATLRGAIDWSWNLLKDYEQSALAQCSVFQNGFFLEAAEAVIDLSDFDDAPFEMDVIEALVEKSLLVSFDVPAIPGEARYRMLESIRQYAGEKLGEWNATGSATLQSGTLATSEDANTDAALESGAPSDAALESSAPSDAALESGAPKGAPEDPTHALLLRHAEHYLEYAEEWDEATHGPRAVEALNRIELEYDNLFGIQEALEHDYPDLAARAILYTTQTLSIRGPWKERIPRIERALYGLSESEDLALRIKLAYMLTLSNYECGGKDELQAASALCRSMASEVPESTDSAHIELRLLAALTLVLSHTRNGNSEEEGAVLDEALTRVGVNPAGKNRGIVAPVRLRRILALSLRMRGEVHRVRGEYDLALTCYSTCEAWWRELGNLTNLGGVISNCGLVHWSRGENDRAMGCFLEAEAIHRQLGHRHGVAACLGNRGLTHGKLRDHDQAIALFDEAEGIARELGQRATVAQNIGNRGLVLARRGEYEQALTSFFEAEKIGRELSAKNSIAINLGNRGNSLRNLKRLSEAWSALGDAESLCRETSNRYPLAYWTLGKAQVLLDSTMKANSDGGNVPAGISLLPEDVLAAALDLAQESLDLRAAMGMQKAEEYFETLATLAVIEHRTGGECAASAREHALAAKALGEELKLDRHEKAPHPKAGEVTEYWQYVDEVLGAGE